MILLAKNGIRNRMKTKRRNADGCISRKEHKHIRVSVGTGMHKSCKTIMAYVDMPKEVKTDIIINTLLNMGKDVAVPVCVPASYELIASKILSLDELKSGHYGILEPKKEYLRPMAPDTFDVILVPGSAFDVYGNRIGHGKGYYDRFLSKVPQETLKIGLAFDYQILPRLPVEHYDIPVNCIITERGIIKHNL